MDNDAIGSAVSEILENRDGRNVWTTVDSECRIWDSIVVGDFIEASCFELMEEGRSVTIKVTPIR